MGQKRSYSENTRVPIERSQAQIRELLNNNSCEKVRMLSAEDGFGVEFVLNGILIRMGIKYPAITDAKIALAGNGKKRAPAQIRQAYDKETRRLFRVLYMRLKMKFELIADDEAHLYDEFMAHMVDPVTNKVFGKLLQPQITARLSGNDASPMLSLPVT